MVQGILNFLENIYMSNIKEEKLVCTDERKGYDRFTTIKG
jgi:hypothetical protein